MKAPIVHESKVAGTNLVLRLVPATERHVQMLMPTLRTLDNTEWVTASGMKTGEALARIIRDHPRWAWAVEVWPMKPLVTLDAAYDPVPVPTETVGCWALWGVVPSEASAELGEAWMVATNEAQRHVTSMHRLFEVGITEMHKLYPRLVAWSYHRNKLHHKWMKRMGFRQTEVVMPLYLHLDFIMFIRTHVRIGK